MATRVRALLALTTVVTLIFLPAPSLAWGTEGHYATCAIAQLLFTKDTQDAVRALLPEDAEGNLASLCSWADHMRFRYRWSRGLHFIDTPDSSCDYNYDRDCHDSNGIQGSCVAGAINNYTSQLTSYFSDSQQYNLTEALLFLAHMVGDIHQPLHVGFTSDLGGNTIKVHWYRRAVNLHHIWDDDIIATATKTFYDSSFEGFVEDLGKNITMGQWKRQISKWDSCSDDIACPDTYAAEGIQLACKWAYKDVTEGSHLEDDYFLTRLPIVELRLAQGGVRLAGILNRLFGKAQVETQ